MALWLAVTAAAAGSKRASDARASPAARASYVRAHALSGHDHGHPVCDEHYRATTVCPAVCDALGLRAKCCVHASEDASILTVAMEAQSRSIAARVERFENCTGGHVELVPFVGAAAPGWHACTGLSCGGFSDLFEIGAAALDDARGGASIYDAYMTQAPDVPLLAPYVEDLSHYIHDTREIAWTDVLRDVRRTHTVNGSVMALPFDAYRRRVEAERKVDVLAADLVAKQCDEANKRIRDFQAPFACIKASEFVTLGRFVCYATGRN